MFIIVRVAAFVLPPNQINIATHPNTNKKDIDERQINVEQSEKSVFYKTKHFNERMKTLFDNVKHSKMFTPCAIYTETVCPFNKIIFGFSSRYLKITILNPFA